MTASPDVFDLRGDYVTLAQAVKIVGMADTGGQAKIMVREGHFLVNGVSERQPGKKLRAGDRFGTFDREWVVTA